MESKGEKWIQRKGSKSDVLRVWPLLNQPLDKTRNLLTAGVHLVGSGYSETSELGSALHFPLGMFTQYAEKYINKGETRIQNTF